MRTYIYADVSACVRACVRASVRAGVCPSKHPSELVQKRPSISRPVQHAQVSEAEGFIYSQLHRSLPPARTSSACRSIHPWLHCALVWCNRWVQGIHVGIDLRNDLNLYHLKVISINKHPSDEMPKNGVFVKDCGKNLCQHLSAFQGEDCED